MATEEERAKLRRVAGQLTDEQLPVERADELLADHRCPPRNGALADSPDYYGAAAAYWQEEADAKAAAEALAADGAGPEVASARSGDESVTYRDKGKATSSQLYALAARMRRRSCSGGARTVRVLGQHQRAPGDGLAAEVGVVEFQEPRHLVPGVDPIVNADAEAWD